MAIAIVPDDARFVWEPEPGTKFYFRQIMPDVISQARAAHSVEGKDGAAPTHIDEIAAEIDCVCSGATGWEGVPEYAPDGTQAPAAFTEANLRRLLKQMAIVRADFFIRMLTPLRYTDVRLVSGAAPKALSDAEKND